MAGVELTALGMASCLGGLVTGCAAQRAGLRRAADALDYQVQPLQELARVPARVCALPGATFGFTGVGRLTAILHEVLLDVGAEPDPPDLPPEPLTELFVALPDPIDLGIPVSERLEDDLAGRVAALGRQVLAGVAALPGGPGERALGARAGAASFFAGRVGFARAAAAAIEALAQRRAGTCWLLALDTLVDRPVLDRLALEQRLKTDDNPVGLVPGEGGAVFRLQPAQGGAGRASRCLLAATALREGARKSRPGRDLAACVGEVTGVAGMNASPPAAAPLLIGDYNGEAPLAEEWGAALAHLRASGAAWAAPTVTFPAVGFGDCGAASGALGLCVAARALARGYAPARAAVVVSSAEDARAALLLNAPPA